MALIGCDQRYQVPTAGPCDVRLVPPPTDPDQGWELATVQHPERYLGNLALRFCAWGRPVRVRAA